MKLSNDGSEALSIRGARALLLSGRVSIVHLEYNPAKIMSTSGVDGRDMLQELDEMGFDAFLSDCKDLGGHWTMIELSKLVGPCDGNRSEALVRALVSGIRSSEIAQFVEPVRYAEFTSILEEDAGAGYCCMVNMLLRCAILRCTYVPQREFSSFLSTCLQNVQQLLWGGGGEGRLISFCVMLAWQASRSSWGLDSRI